MPFQNTLARPVEIEGIGLHTGKECWVRLSPAAADTGIVFSKNSTTIPASAAHVVSSRRATVLGKAGVEISTVEHLLAALSGAGIDNAAIEVEGPELPVLDGSAAGFIAIIREAGRKRLPTQANIKQLAAPVWVSEANSLLLALPAASLRVTYLGNFPSLGSLQRSWTISPSIFAEEIAPARTTVLKKEIEALLAQGLGRGGSVENVVVLEEENPPAGMRFPDEPLRHKVLDLIGDLTLLGERLQAHIIAVRSGHSLNLELVKKILEA